MKHRVFGAGIGIRALAVSTALLLLATLGSAGAQSVDTSTPPPQAAPPPHEAAPAAAAGPLVPGRVIEPGDQLSIAVFGQPDLTVTPTVMGDGTIAYPLLKTVKVAGLTPEAASALLTRELETYVKHPQVDLSIAAPGEMRVLVLGDVVTAGALQIRSGGRLTDAIAAAGGVGPTNGDLPNVRVTEPDGHVQTVSLQRLLHDGMNQLNVPLRNDAVVYVVGPTTITVEVVGAVARPGNVEVDQGDRLSNAIAEAGPSPGLYSDLSHVYITRTGPDGKTTKQEIDMYKELQHGSHQGDPILQKGDVVYVPQGKRPANIDMNPLDILGL